MSPRVGLVHATLAAVQPMVAAFCEHAPGVNLLHFLDEGLLPLVNRDGLTGPAVLEIERLVSRAVASGVDGVLLTCSAFSPVVPALQTRFTVPIVSVDEAMLREALQHGSRIGVVATVETAGPTTAALLREYARENGQIVEITVNVVPAAFASLRSGDAASHDLLVREHIAALLPACDVVVLAQISMARALADGPPYPKPVLTCPRASVRAMISRLRANDRSS